MSRPAFCLSDDEARVLVRHLVELNERHPLDRRDHRPFVRDFLRAVHDATGRTFSPVIYRRLLKAYAPERRPSTATLALEKDNLVDELARPGRAATELGTVHADSLGELVRRAVAEGFTHAAPMRAGGADAYALAQCAFLQERLGEAEDALREARAQAARFAADAQAAREVAQALQREADAARLSMVDQAAAIARLAAAGEDARIFAMKAIDEARGETRAWKDRCAHAEEQLKQESVLMETFRQLAYQRGAAIPAALRTDKT